MANKVISWDQAVQYRLSRQILLKPATLHKAADVVASVCGVQAQVLSAAELGIAARTREIDHNELHKEIWEKRSLVKTYGPRGTLHLLPAAELTMWMAAMRAREARQGEDQHVGAGFSSAQAHAVAEAIGEALDGRSLTREQLAKDVAKRVGSWAEEGMRSAWGVLLAPAAYSGLLCFGPSEGAKVTFVRADQWIKNWKSLDENDALRQMARKYLSAYGPARSQDFARWFWLDKVSAAKIFQEISGDLVEVEFERHQSWVIKSSLKEVPAGSHQTIFLLPQYDSYTIGCVPRERLILAQGRPRILSHGRGRFESATGLPVLLVNGQVSGIWSRKATGKKVAIKVESFIKLSAAQKDKVEKQAARFAEFFNLALSFNFGKLS